jgi:hypothetical protein
MSVRLSAAIFRRTVVMTAAAAIITAGAGTANASAPTVAPAARPVAASVVPAGTFGPASSPRLVVSINATGTLTFQAVGGTSTLPGTPITNATWRITFSQDTTRRIYEAAVAGSASLAGLICGAGPAWVKAACNVIIPVVVVFVKFADPAGRCLQVEVKTKLGWPPVVPKARYVTC